jgi:NADH:ubiquinone oxidoreductase subunit F (NADH-binding)
LATMLSPARAIEDLDLIRKLCQMMKRNNPDVLGQLAPGPVAGTPKFFRHESQDAIPDSAPGDTGTGRPWSSLRRKGYL